MKTALIKQPEYWLKICKGTRSSTVQIFDAGRTACQEKYRVTAPARNLEADLALGLPRDEIGPWLQKAHHAKLETVRGADAPRNRQSARDYLRSAASIDRGLHRVKDHLDGRANLGPNCRLVRDHLTELIARTELCAPVRTRPYPLERPAARRLAVPSTQWWEKHWEEAMWRTWSNRPAFADGDAVWERIVSYQVMTRNTNDDEAWGEIDLLAIDQQMRPVVIELKSQVCQETPLRPLLEGVSYAIAIRKAWVSGRFGRDWEKVAGGPVSLPRTWPVVCASPSGYLDGCQGLDGLDELRGVARAIESFGFEVSWVEVAFDSKASHVTACELPRLVAARRHPIFLS